MPASKTKPAPSRRSADPRDEFDPRRLEATNPADVRGYVRQLPTKAHAVAAALTALQTVGYDMTESDGVHACRDWLDTRDPTLAEAARLKLSMGRNVNGEPHDYVKPERELLLLAGAERAPGERTHKAPGAGHAASIAAWALAQSAAPGVDPTNSARRLVARIEGAVAAVLPE